MGDKSITYLVVFLFILGLLLGGYEEIWEKGARRVASPQFSTVEEEDNIYLEVIWDASGSMWGRESGIEKILRSKEVLKTFAEEIPQEVNIGLRIFGARRVGDLEDSFLALPLHNQNREAILNFITNVKPLGKSPIAFSLKEAKEDLRKVNGRKYILLISDGLDNGDLPAASVVEELKEAGITLHIVHVGELDNEDLRLKLQAMAEKTGGQYFTYLQHDELIPTFQQ